MRCLKCGHVRAAGDPGPDYACPNCQAVYAKMQALVAGQQAEREKLALARRTGDWSGIDARVLRDELAAVALATTSDLPGRRVEQVIGIVSADFAHAFGALNEAFGGLMRNIVGSGKSWQTVAFLREGRAEVLQALRMQALGMSADAVVGVKLDYEEFSGANNLGVLVITATGTAVRAAPHTPG